MKKKIKEKKEGKNIAVSTTMHNSLPVMVSRHNLLEIMASYSHSKRSWNTGGQITEIVFLKEKKKERNVEGVGREAGEGRKRDGGRRNGKNGKISESVMTKYSQSLQVMMLQQGGWVNLNNHYIFQPEGKEETRTTTKHCFGT